MKTGLTQIADIPQIGRKRGKLVAHKEVGLVKTEGELQYIANLQKIILPEQKSNCSKLHALIAEFVSLCFFFSVQVFAFKTNAVTVVIYFIVCNILVKVSYRLFTPWESFTTSSHCAFIS